MKIFSGSSNKPLAKKIADSLGLNLSPLEIHIFPDGEKRVRIMEKVVDEDVVVVQSTGIPTDSNYMELFFIADALKRSGAREITAVIPYLGYQRQDHVFRTGEAVSLQAIIAMLEAVKISKVITVDLHSIRIPELFSKEVVHLSALSLFADKLRELGFLESAFLIAPDMGGIHRVQKLSEMLGGLPYGSIEKNRDLSTGDITANEINLPGKIEDLKDKTIFIVDDMISSGKTLIQAANLMKDKGVAHIFSFATHPVFSENAKYVLDNSALERVFVTDTIEVPDEKSFNKLEILSVADMVAKSL